MRFWLYIVGFAVLAGCRIPEPTRIEDPASKSAKPEKTDPVGDLQRSIQEMKADRQAIDEEWDQKLRSLQDKVDILEHELQNDRRKTEKISQDLDGRLVILEKRSLEQAKNVFAPPVVSPQNQNSLSNNGSTSTLPPPSTLVPEKTVASSAETEYQAILDQLLEEKAYDKSIRDFKKYVQKYPDHPMTSNAQYWIAESYYSKRDYAKAITEFQKVLDQYPQSPKRCDSLLKQGMSFNNMKDYSNAKLFLQETKSQCASTMSASKADKLLKTIR